MVRGVVDTVVVVEATSTSLSRTTVAIPHTTAALRLPGAIGFPRQTARREEARTANTARRNTSLGGTKRDSYGPTSVPCV